MENALIRSFRLFIPLLAALLLGCSTPNRLSHSHDYYGSRQSKTEYRYHIKHRLKKSPVYLIGGLASGIFGAAHMSSNSGSKTTSSSSSSNSLFALAGLGFGAYAIYTWIKLEEIDQTFAEYGKHSISVLPAPTLGLRE
jgi:hypothetical protein